MAGLADDWPENRQTCVDVLCAYLRMPYEPDPGQDAPEPERLAFRASREVRHTVIRVIVAHLKDDAAVSWQGTRGARRAAAARLHQISTAHPHTDRMRSPGRSFPGRGQLAAAWPQVSPRQVVVARRRPRQLRADGSPRHARSHPQRRSCASRPLGRGKRAYEQVAFATYHRGYGVIQGTRPQTIGDSLTDTPVGLAAWLLDHDTTSHERLALLFAGHPAFSLPDTPSAPSRATTCSTTPRSTGSPTPGRPRRGCTGNKPKLAETSTPPPTSPSRRQSRCFRRSTSTRRAAGHRPSELVILSGVQLTCNFSGRGSRR